MPFTYLFVSASIKTKCLFPLQKPEHLLAGVRSWARRGGRVKAHTIRVISHKYTNELAEIEPPPWAEKTFSLIQEDLFRTQHLYFRPQIPDSTFHGSINTRLRCFLTPNVSAF